MTVVLILEEWLKVDVKGILKYYFGMKTNSLAAVVATGKYNWKINGDWWPKSYFIYLSLRGATKCLYTKT